MLIHPRNYQSRAQCSPSRFKLARLCVRADAWRYVAGIKEHESVWEDIKDIPRPEKDYEKGDKIAAKAHGEAVKAWNRMRRGPLGKACHTLLEDWYASHRFGGALFEEERWKTEPGRIVLAGLNQLSHPSNLHSWENEVKIPDNFVHDISGGVFSYEFNAYIDLLYTRKVPTVHGYEGVDDFKTSSSFDWMLTPAALLDDPQGIVYPLFAMHRRRVGPGVVTPIGSGNTESIVGRWTYFLTEGTAQARPVDFKVTYDGAKKRALKLFAEGATLVQRCVDKVDPLDVPGNVLACRDFYHRTCIYHHSVGGPCTIEEPTAGQRLRAVLADPAKRERIEMSFKDKKNAAGGSSAAANKPDTSASESSSAGTSESAQGAGEGAVDTGSADASGSGADTDSGAAAGGARRGRKPRDASDLGSVTVTFAKGETFELPAASPHYTKLVGIHSALFGE